MWLFHFAHGQQKFNLRKCLLTWKKHKNKSIAKTSHTVADIIATYHSLVSRLLPRLSAGEEPGYEANLSNPEVLFKALTLLVNLLYIFIYTYVPLP